MAREARCLSSTPPGQGSSIADQEGDLCADPPPPRGQGVLKQRALAELPEVVTTDWLCLSWLRYDDMAGTYPELESS